MDENIRSANVQRAWQALIEGRDMPGCHVEQHVIDSWERSIKNCVDPYMDKGKIYLNKNDIKKRMTEKGDIIGASIQVMDNLYEFVKGSGFVVMLCDEHGYILRCIGDDEIMQSAYKLNFAEGANWSEESVGTNAIGLAIKLDRPIQIFADEHFCYNFKSWTCSSAPIHYKDKIVGVLNMSAHYSKVNPHTLGMVVAAANAIENLIIKNETVHDLSITNDILSMIMGNIDDGIIATDNSDNIIRVNTRIYDVLHIKQEDLIGKPLTELIDKEDIAKLKSQCNMSIFREVVFKKGSSHFCNVRCKNIIDENRLIGTVYMISEAQKVKNLVNKVTGFNAYFNFEDIKGKNKKFLETVEMAKIAAKSSSNVLLIGESGTGKEMFAQAIHNNSFRKNGPFIAVNCGAVPRELIASELFGYVEGAFTGARKYGNPGKFELAEGGTIFLDEVGDMPLDMQVALLRVLEDKTITRIGGNKQIPVDVRIIAATNKDLKKAVQSGSFRKDLYFRLNVLTINMVPLRERIDDLEIFIDFFIKKYNTQLGKNIRGITDTALQRFKEHKWPGNIRELENAIERAVNVSEEYIDIDSLPSDIVKNPVKNREIGTLDDVERDTILQALIQNDFNITQTAKKLGIGKTTLYRKIRLYNISGLTVPF
ncbi:MAG: sigma 54-interacting transcriptional regulator [Thermoanaerobacteraceae bacterium]|nr:sigma 54-interacting transcriptional regulator [Thermoanaerobacteraceae bacterium]